MDKVAEVCTDKVTWEDALMALAFFLGVAAVIWAFGKMING